MKNLSLPKAFITRAENYFKNEADDFFHALLDKPLISIRKNPKKWDQSYPFNQVEQVGRQVPWCMEALYLDERPIFTADPLLHAGAYYVQEASSMFLSVVLDQIISNEDPICVLDLCAAPGGKSTLINSKISENSLLVANEVIKSRSVILEENLTKWGYDNFVVTSNDPKDFKKLTHFFDIIIIDAPCSGEGMFRKDPDATNEWSENNIKTCTARQERIVDDIISALKPGGHLIYCTCTFAPEENEENIQRFVKQYDLQGVKITCNDQWGIEQKQSPVWSYHFYPHKVLGEGFFLACLQKPAEDMSTNSFSKAKFKGLELLQKKQIEDISPWLKDGSRYDYYLHQEQVVAFPKSMTQQIAFLSSLLYIKYAGIVMGKLMGKQLIPSHNLAVNIAINETVPDFEVDLNTALQFLKKGDIVQIDYVKKMMDLLPHGWILIKYEKRALGWIKKIGNRINNYYPKEMRILKDY